MLKSNKKIWFSVGLVFSLVLVLCLLPSATSAEPSANLYFLPTAGTFEKGQSFEVRAAVDTGGQAINAVEDVISFSNDTLQLDSISKSETILSLWIKEPFYDNSTGKITFAGAIPNPGFTGLGRLFKIYFKAKSSGSAWIKFNSAKVLANDGLGTNILGSIGRADFTIKEPTLPAPVPVKLPEVLLIVSKISSSTHADQDKWYVQKDAVFNWSYTQGVFSFSYLIDQSPDTNPDNIGEGMDTSISYLDVTDGVWYFHLKANNRKGWGDPAHYKIQIDTAAPDSLEIVSAEDFPTSNPSPLFRFKANDEMSGIEYIEVQIDTGEFVRLDKMEYQTPILTPKQHNILARATDRAGNYIEKSIDFEISPLLVPQITYWTQKILFGEPYLVKGMAAPETKINLTIVSEDKQELILTTTSDSNGVWVIQYRNILKKGDYRFYAAQEIVSGAVSPPSKEESFSVLTNTFRVFGVVFPASAFVWLIIFLLAVVAFLVILVFLLHKPFKKIRKKR